jgi:nitroimidazol reductase NimA-like FMN-containing flavoprotein (pyridoxamine 5'-phosphate oxidase superfamily)
MPFDDGLVRLNRQECMALLATASFARVGVSVDALPAILPVTIALMDDAVVFRTVPGTKLAFASARSIIAVEADSYDSSERDGWSVLVRGVATELVDAGPIVRARDLLADSWLTNDDAAHYVSVTCDLVTGRRLVHSSSRAHRA